MTTKYNDSINFYFSEDQINISNYSKEELLEILSLMILIRESEYKIAQGRKNGVVHGPVHLGAGQEAIAVGIARNLSKNDMVFGAHRSHSHIISLGINLRNFFAEILAKKTGLSKGMGGSMHLYGGSVGFYGSVPIVAATVPLAVGTALASKLKDESATSIVYLGDGAIEEGVVHESLNFARINHLPVIFVVENNQFSSHLNIKLRQPFKLTRRFAESNDIESITIDGNDVMSICNVSKKFISRCREKQGPFFIEALTYRWFGHVDWREDIDVGVHRTKEDLNNWKKRDPIKRLFTSLQSEMSFSSEEYDLLNNRIKQKINLAWDQALKDPSPSWDETTKYLFKM